MTDLSTSDLESADPRYWRGLRYVMLEIIHPYLGPERILDNADIQNIIGALSITQGFVTRNDLKTLQDVIDRLKSHGCISKSEPVPYTRQPPRPSMLARSPIIHRAVPIVDSLNQFMWDYWLAQPLDRDRLLFPFMFSLMVDGGFGLPFSPRGFFGIQKNDILDDRRLRLPLHHRNRSDHCSVLAIPASSQILLAHAIRARHQEPGTALVFKPDMTEPKTRHRWLAQWLRSEYLLFVHAFKQETYTDGPSWRTFLKAAPQRALHAGACPATLFTQSNTPLPVFVPVHNIRTARHTPDRHRLAPIARSNLTPGDNAELVISLSRSVPTNWPERSSRLLYKLVQSLSNLTSRSLTAPAYRERAIAIIRAARRDADLLCQNARSALHLALDWGIHQVQTAKSQTAGTLGHYFERVFTTGLLCHPETANFDQMDVDDHLDIFQDSINRTEIGYSRQLDILSTWRSVYDFGTSQGYISKTFDIDLDGALYEARRPFLLSPFDFDQLFEDTWAKGAWEYQTLAVLYALFFYGGLRSDEAVELTTRDFVIGHDLLDIYVSGTKSLSAPRIIPFGHLAPNRIVECVREYWSKRLALTTTSDGHIFLFGPETEISRYDTTHLNHYGRHTLRIRLGGRPSLHGLRHSFASWLFLRLTVLGDSALLATLPEKNHAIFQPQALQKLHFLLTGCSGAVLSEDHSTGLREIARLLGHADPTTLLEIYVHTFELAQSRMQLMLDEKLGGEIRLNRKVMAALLPNMKSSRSRAKIAKKMTPRQLLDIAWAQN